MNPEDLFQQIENWLKTIYLDLPERARRVHQKRSIIAFCDFLRPFRFAEIEEAYRHAGRPLDACVLSLLSRAGMGEAIDRLRIIAETSADVDEAFTAAMGLAESGASDGFRHLSQLCSNDSRFENVDVFDQLDGWIQEIDHPKARELESKYLGESRPLPDRARR